MLAELRNLAAAAICRRHGEPTPNAPKLAANELQALEMAALVEEARRDVNGNINGTLLLSVLFLKMRDILQKNIH